MSACECAVQCIHLIICFDFCICSSKVAQRSVRSSRSSTASSSRCKAEADRAALFVQAEDLKKKFALEREEVELI